MNARIKLSKVAMFAMVLCSVLTAVASFGQATRIWTGGGDGINIDSNANWGGVLPSTSTGDTAEWNGVTTSNLFLVNNSALFASGPGMSGLNIYLTSNQTNSVNIDTTLSLSQGFCVWNVTVDSNAGPLSFGGTNTAHLFYMPERPAGVVHHWINNSTNPVTINPRVQFKAGGGSPYVMDFGGTGNFIINNYLESDGSTGGIFVEVDGPGTMIWTPQGYLASDLITGVYITGGTLILEAPHFRLNTSNITNNGAFIFNASSPLQTQTLARAIFGSGSVTVAGGVLTLAGTNNYSGQTTVSGGKLVFQSPKTGSGDISLAGGATLGVFATNSPVTTGTLTVGTSSGATLEFNNVNDPTTPLIAASTLSAAGTITINVNSGTFTAGQSYPLLAWTNGTAPSVSLGVLNGCAGNLSTVGNVLYLNVTAVAGTTLNFTPNDNSMQLSWPGSFKLQAQTNTLTGTNWVDYPGGGTSPVTVTIDPANGSVFFRLISTP